MPSTRLSTKGQLIIPKDMRERRGWTAGTTLEVEERGECIVLRAARKAPRTKVNDLLGCLPWSGPAKTLGEMAAAIAKGAREAR